jgi:transposase
MELRERVVNAWLADDLTQEEVAERFSVGLQTVVRWVGRLRRTGSLAPGQMGGARRPYAVDEAGAVLVRDLIDCMLDITLPELCAAYEESRGVKISAQTMSDTVRRLGYTKKKAVFRGSAANRPEVVAEREEFTMNQPKLDASKLVFLDEAGVDTAMSRAYGWAPPGITPVIERPAHGKRISLIGAIALDGTRALREVEGYVNGDVFVSFLREDLGPHLNPGDIVIMDGPSIHKVAGVAEALAERGATPLYLPAYSPELNPIEMTWAWIKRLLRTVGARRMPQLRERLAEYWRRVSADLCAGWFRHSGYQST